MTSLLSKDSSKLRPVTVPIPTESIKEYFTDKEIVFMVDYANSRLKGQTFLTYLSNLNIPSDVVFGPDFTEEMYFEVMKAYMSQRMVVTSECLNVHVAQLLLLAKGVKYENIPYKTNIGEETIFKFLEDNLDMVLRWLHFIDSSMIFCTFAIESLNREFKPFEKLEVIEDKEYVGHNVVNLYTLPMFTQCYFGLEGATYRESFFKHQFEDYMFANQRLVKYFNHPSIIIAHVFEGMASGAIDKSNPLGFFEAGKI